MSVCGHNSPLKPSGRSAGPPPPLLTARLVDELRIHLSPLVLGGGTWLFDHVGPTTLVQREVTESPRATHLTYEVIKD